MHRNIGGVVWGHSFVFLPYPPWPALCAPPRPSRPRIVELYQWARPAQRGCGKGAAWAWLGGTHGLQIGPDRRVGGGCLRAVHAAFWVASAPKCTQLEATCVLDALTAAKAAKRGAKAFVTLRMPSKGGNESPVSPPLRCASFPMSPPRCARTGGSWACHTDRPPRSAATRRNKKRS